MKTKLLVLAALLTSSLLLQAGEIHKAARKGDAAKVKALLDGDPKLISSAENKGTGYTPLHVACIAGQKAVVELLIASHADINGEDLSGETPLHMAALHRRPEIIAVLVKNKANINARDKEKRNALFCALNRMKPGTKETIEALLACKIDVNAKDAADQTPLDLAKNLNDDAITALLKKNGAK